MSVNGVNKNNYHFSGIESVKKQSVQENIDTQKYTDIKEKDFAETEKNAVNTDKVEISFDAEKQQNKSDEREQIYDLIKRQEESRNYYFNGIYYGDKDTVKKAMAARMAKIQNKMLSGRNLTGAERLFLRQHYPHLSAIAERIAFETQQLKNKLKTCKSKEEAKRIYMQAKMSVVGDNSKQRSNFVFIVPTMDKTYSDYVKTRRWKKESNK